MKKFIFTSLLLSAAGHVHTSATNTTTHFNISEELQTLLKDLENGLQTLDKTAKKTLSDIDQVLASGKASFFESFISASKNLIAIIETQKTDRIEAFIASKIKPEDIDKTLAFTRFFKLDLTTQALEKYASTIQAKNTCTKS